MSSFFIELIIDINITMINCLDNTQFPEPTLLYFILHRFLFSTSLGQKECWAPKVLASTKKYKSKNEHLQ